MLLAFLLFLLVPLLLVFAIHSRLLSISVSFLLGQKFIFVLIFFCSLPLAFNNLRGIHLLLPLNLLKVRRTVFLLLFLSFNGFLLRMDFSKNLIFEKQLLKFHLVLMNMVDGPQLEELRNGLFRPVQGKSKLFGLVLFLVECYLADLTKGLNVISYQFYGVRGSVWVLSGML